MIELLSEYYARMTEQIFAYQGMLKEYVGDELLAIFGAPLEQPDHAERACAAALAMRAHRNVLREAWTRLGRPPLITRTGIINSGRMLVGNLGSKYRFAYSVLGDHVNLGSRLEGLNSETAQPPTVGQGDPEKDGTLCQSGGVVASCHSLRHTFASNLLEQGAEIVSIRELLGHASITSSERYAKVSNQKVKQEYVRTMKKVLQHSKV
jgi:Phage integrase family/Adenylate and Guanylate cyclase catalytic domain